MKGHLLMSAKERECAKLFERVKAKELRIKDAAQILGLSYRQCRRRYQRFAQHGDAGLLHRARGQASNRASAAEVKEAALTKYQERYGDFGPTLAAEKLRAEGVVVDHETLRRWLLAAGLWSPRRQRARHRSRRPMRLHFGELVQLDGSHHHWFEERGAQCCLMNMVDDATKTTLAMLSEEETTFAAMRVLWRWIETYGIPRALYTDQKNVYVVDEKSRLRAQHRGEEAVTQFGRACQRLGIKIITAHSPQAKGRVERNHAIYQDRLVKELRLAGVNGIDEANRILASRFVRELNEKFSVEPQDGVDYHRSAEGYDLSAIFCIEEPRVVTSDWMVRYENQHYQLKRESRGYAPAKGQVLVRQYLDGALHINYRGRDIEYEVLSPSPQKVRPSAVRQPVPPAKRKSAPAADHPWRQYKLGAKSSDV